ncbi:uncharacterized protein LOC144645842 [Oculina patagonica]
MLFFFRSPERADKRDQIQMENLKELLTAKTFNRLSYAAVISWVLFGVILLGIFAEMDNSESRFDFRCGAKSENMDLVRGKCFEQYEQQYSKFGIPVYGFVIVNFSTIAIVCVIYSQFVKSRVEQLLEANLNRDAERQRPPETRKLFAAYCCQLAARLSLGIIFIVLQTQLLYPLNFPSSFNCYDMPESSRAANESIGNIQNRTLYECHNQRATKKTFWMYALIVVNGFFALILSTEIMWILLQAGRKDLQFLADHLNPGQLPQERASEEPLQPPQGPQEQEPEQLVSQEIPLEELPSSIIPGFIRSLKRSVIENTEKPSDLKALFTAYPGEGESTKDLNIDKIYTNLVLHPKRAQYDFPEDREEQLKVYPRPKDLDAENLKPKGPEDIVDTENKKILIIGRPGIGKSLFSTKFLRDWASGKIFNDTQDTELHFNIAFLIKFRRFNVKSSNSEERLSLVPLSLRELLESAEFLPTEHLPDDVWNDIVGNPEKVLILFDGMDELADEDLKSINNEAVNDSYRDNVEQKMPLATLYAKLMNGKLLRGASVLTTTRPTAVSSIEKLHGLFHRTFEILGFAHEQVDEYAENFTKEAAENLSGAGEQIRHHITSNMNLFSFCYVPVNCFIICSSLLEKLKCSPETGLTGGLPVKLTQIYKIATRLFFFRHNEQYREKTLSREEIESDKLPHEVEEKFKVLGELAFKGIKQRKLIFGSNEVPQGLANSSLFHKMPDRKIGPFKHEAQFCFIHLTMQEFLAAKHITDTMNEAELRTFVKDHINKGEWHVVLEFVAGLLGERDKQLKIFTDLLPEKTEETYEAGLMLMSPESEQRTLTCWPTRSEKHLALTIIKCLHEGSESNVVLKSKLKNIRCNAVDFSRCSLSPADCTAIVHVFKHVQQISLIDLFANNIGPLGCAEITKLFDNDNSQLTHLNLGYNRIGDEGVKQLSKVIVNSNLESLNLSGNNITDKGLNYLSDKLVNTKVKSLNLSYNNITDKGLNYLSDKLVNTKVKSLDLSSFNSNITREAEQRIQDANPNCWVFI